jgi:hypothetical protein
MPYDPQELAKLDVSVLREITERNVSLANAPTLQEPARRPAKVPIDKAIGDLIFTSQVLIEKADAQSADIADLREKVRRLKADIVLMERERLAAVACMILTIMAACAAIPFVTVWFVVGDALMVGP